VTTPAAGTTPTVKKEPPPSLSPIYFFWSLACAVCTIVGIIIANGNDTRAIIFTMVMVIWFAVMFLVLSLDACMRWIARRDQPTAGSTDTTPTAQG
jgi:hypothetical protein